MNANNKKVKWIAIWVFLFALALLVAWLFSVNFTNGHAASTSTEKVWMPVMLRPFIWRPSCLFNGFDDAKPRFSIWCNMGELPLEGSGWMNLTENANGSFDLTGCMPWGVCASMATKPSNVPWQYDSFTGITTISPVIDFPGRPVGPGYYNQLVTPQGYITAYGCWVWSAECQVSP